jgi:hypothetical protein
MFQSNVCTVHSKDVCCCVCQKNCAGLNLREMRCCTEWCLAMRYVLLTSLQSWSSLGWYGTTKGPQLPESHQLART